MRKYQRVSNNVPRHHRKAPNKCGANHEEADRKHDAEREKHGLDRRPIGCRYAVEAGKQSVHAMGQDQ